MARSYKKDFQHWRAEREAEGMVSRLSRTIKACEGGVGGMTVERLVATLPQAVFDVRPCQEGKSHRFGHDLLR